MSFASAASAAYLVTTFKLDVTEVSQFGSGVLGTVTVTDYLNGLVAFDISLTDPADYTFRAAADRNHHALTFDLTNNGQTNGTPDTGLTISNLQSTIGVHPFSQAAGTSFDNKPFTGFDYAVNCSSTACTKGFTNTNPTHMSFTMTGIHVDPEHLIANYANNLASVPYHPKTGGTQNIFFAVDLIRRGGGTGAVGATFWNEVEYAPEPETWSLLILGFGCIGADLRRRRRAALAA
jgi:hypothetical protein